MGRVIGGIVVGYLAMFAWVFVSFSITFLAMGTDRAFKPDVFEPSGLWIGVSFLLGAIAAILGGWLCARIAPATKAPIALAVIVLCLGLLMAIPALTADPAQVARPPGLGPLEAMKQGHQPGWTATLNAFIGAVGTLLGARLRTQRITPSLPGEGPR